MNPTDDSNDANTPEEMAREVVPLMKRYSKMSQIGLEFVAPLIAGLIVDKTFDCLPWCTIAGAILGMIAGTAHLIMLANRAEQESERL